MSEAKYRVLVVASHPVQYSVPFFRLMAQHPKLETLVAYLSLQGAQPVLDRDYGVEIAWDIPLLEGYKWVQLPNRSPKPGLRNFLGLINPQLWELIRTGNFDLVISYTGYAYASFWIVVAAAKTFGIPLIFGTDSSSLSPRSGKTWKLRLKQLLLPHLFNLADVAIVSSTPGKKLIQSLGIPQTRIVLTPFVVDNDWWSDRVKEVERAKVCAQWGIAEEIPVVLFCAKLQPWKRPQDLLQAFAKLDIPEVHLVYAGDGPMREELQTEAQALGVAERVRFLGFLNQSQLPPVYRTADLLVLPSEYEPFGVVVNEAMLCSCPVVVSDRVGAHYDLVRRGETGFVYPCGDVDALAVILKEILSNREILKKMKETTRQRMETWSPRENVEAVVKAIEKAVYLKGRNINSKQAIANRKKLTTDN